MYYAPVRRSAKSLARLACVKPAANVRSEPGSNSQLDVDVSERSELYAHINPSEGWGLMG